MNGQRWLTGDIDMIYDGGSNLVTARGVTVAPMSPSVVAAHSRSVLMRDRGWEGGTLPPVGCGIDTSHHCVLFKLLDHEDRMTRALGQQTETGGGSGQSNANGGVGFFFASPSPSVSIYLLSYLLYICTCL